MFRSFKCFFGNISTSSVVPERVQRTIVHELVHILGERELKVLYFCLIYIIVSAFILAFVNAALSQFNLVQECQVSIELSRRKPS